MESAESHISLVGMWTAERIDLARQLHADLGLRAIINSIGKRSGHGDVDVLVAETINRTALRYREPGNPSAMATVVARRLCIDEHRARAIRPTCIGTDFDERVWSDSRYHDPSPAEVVENRMVADGILAELPSKDRELVKMIIFGSLTAKEVGRRLNIPEGTVKSRFHYAIRRAREIGHNYR